MVFKIDEVLLFFAAYAIMGWISEVIFAALKTGRFVNRGFLNGPLCPIYGFGVVAVVLALDPVKDSLILLFLGSFVLTTALEFLTGLILEKVFHDHWWDYSKEPFNIKGYVCLRFSIMWGIACVMVVKVLHPLVAGGIDALPLWLRWTIIGVFYVYLFADLAVTVTDIQKFNRGMGKMAEQLHDISDFAGEHIAGAAIELGTKGEILRTELETKKSELETKKTELEAKKDEAKARMETRRDAYEAFFSMPAVRRKKRLFKAFPDLKSQLRERMIRQTGEEYRAELEDLFEKTFGRK